MIIKATVYNLFDIEERTPIYINMDNFVAVDERGGKTSIFFTSGMHIDVNESQEDIAKVLSDIHAIIDVTESGQKQTDCVSK